MKYHRYYSPLSTAQSQPIPGREAEMARNEAGGYVFSASDWERLERFLILGAEDGYYAKAPELTIQNAQALLRCLLADGQKVVNMIVDVSVNGRAPKNEAAIFALAMASSPKLADKATNSLALAVLPKVARTGTYLFQFVEAAQAMRGWGRSLREAVSNWYNGKSPENLAYQLTKYRQRGGWTHRDVLRLAHPLPASPIHDMLFRWTTKGAVPEVGDLTAYIRAFESVQKAENPATAAAIIEAHRLTWEMVPTTLLKQPVVWEALLEHIPYTALLRNLNRLTAIGVIKPLGEWTETIATQLAEQVSKTRPPIHPIALLNTLAVYQQGHGEKGSLKWDPAREIVDALNEAFYAAFKNVQPTGKRILLALDVSGSMSAKAEGSFLEARQIEAAMALVTASVEPKWHIVGFTNRVHPLSISPHQRLDDVLRAMPREMEGTDCAVSIQYALDKGLDVDAIVQYTDNQTWAGQEHTVQTLEKYRQKVGHPIKIVAAATAAYEAAILDPKDPDSLNIVGWDSAAPAVISQFLGAVAAPSSAEED